MNTTERKAMEQALEALEAMKAEFRALDLPYGSKAYTQGNHASHELRAALAEQTPVAADDAGIYEFWARDKESEQKASKELDPKDIWVELIAKPVSGFAPTMTNGVRLTHRPTGISVEETDERSSHKNKHIAWEKLKQLVAAAEAEAEQVTNIGCLGMPVNTPVTAPQPAIPPGYKLVPVEPTPEMEAAGAVARVPKCEDLSSLSAARYAYRAMLAAAPEAPQPAKPAEQDDVRDAETELNCAEEVLDGYAAHLDLKETAFDCIGDYITAVCEALKPAKPAERVPLTDDEIAALWLSSISGPLTAAKFARAVERAHGITGETK